MCVFNSISKPRIRNFRVQFPPITPVSLYMGYKKKKHLTSFIIFEFSSFLFAIKQKIHVSTSFTSEFDQLVAVSSMLPEDGLSVAFPEHFPKIFYDVQRGYSMLFWELCPPNKHCGNEGSRAGTTIVTDFYSWFTRSRFDFVPFWVSQKYYNFVHLSRICPVERTL